MGFFPLLDKARLTIKRDGNSLLTRSPKCLTQGGRKVASAHESVCLPRGRTLSPVAMIEYGLYLICFDLI